MTRDVDPITFAVIKSALDTIVDDMAYTVMRTARSSIVRDVLDYSVTLCDRQGRILTAIAEMVPSNSKPFSLDRSTVRITVIGQGRAVDIQGCRR